MSAMRLVDIDAMLGPHPRREVGNGTVPELLSILDRVGIAEAVVTHAQSWLHDPAIGNRLLTDEIAGNPRLHAAWVFLPETCGEVGTAADFVSSAQRAGVVAVRAYPQDHGYDLAGADVASMLDAIAAAHLPLLVDAVQTSWPAIESVAHRHPELTVIACRAGYRTLRRIAGVLERVPNVHLDTANLSSHCGLEWLVERFGARRLFFGTAVPEHDPAETVTRLLWSELSDADIRTIGAENFAGLPTLTRSAA